MSETRYDQQHDSGELHGGTVSHLHEPSSRAKCPRLCKTFVNGEFAITRPVAATAAPPSSIPALPLLSRLGPPRL
jgi:hypothetical protein